MRRQSHLIVIAIILAACAIGLAYTLAAHGGM